MHFLHYIFSSFLPSLQHIHTYIHTSENILLGFSLLSSVDGRAYSLASAVLISEILFTSYLFLHIVNTQHLNLFSTNSFIKHAHNSSTVTLSTDGAYGGLSACKSNVDSTASSFKSCVLPSIARFSLHQDGCANDNTYIVDTPHTYLFNIPHVPHRRCLLLHSHLLRLLSSPFRRQPLTVFKLLPHLGPHPRLRPPTT